MKKTVFTICSKNYLGLAQVLENSIKSHCSNVNFLIYIADEFTPEVEIENPQNNVYIAKEVLEIPKELWNELTFKYDLTEFCTCIKPSCFKHIFKNFNSEYCIYLDPDILLFSSLDFVFKKLEQYSIILTPHITSLEEIYTGKLNEQNLLFSGMYNLGFIAVKNNDISFRMLNWWEGRLKDRCYRSTMENYFTDQKWIDFLPSLLPTELLISFHLGLNLAPWNFHEREIVIRDGCLFVISRIKNENKILYPLIFVHYSGFNYNLLFNGEVLNSNIRDLNIYEDLKYVFQEYSLCLKRSNFLNYINLPYSYSIFTNSIYISSVYRKLFRRLSEDGKVTSNPFDHNGQFYLQLKKNGLIKGKMVNLDISSIENIYNATQKTVLTNRIFNFLFRIIGVRRYFLLLRLMRIYSKIENHCYLVDPTYLNNYNLRH